jgi:hypothetical protein
LENVQRKKKNEKKKFTRCQVSTSGMSKKFPFQQPTTVVMGHEGVEVGK